jgi:hydroxymethylpyrimidine/phosphomethylpyrimidine kinase
MTHTPVIMSISNHDPCGSAGISADIETLASLGCHCTPIITRISARDTAALKDDYIIDSSLLLEQIRAVLEDIPINLIKVGNLGSVANIETVSTILNDYPNIQVVLHTDIDRRDNKLDQALRSLLLPQATIAIFNERQTLSLATKGDTLAACAQELLEYECQNIFITSSKNTAATIHNHWYTTHNHSQDYSWPRLQRNFLGAGATLSAALSGYLGHGISMAESIQQAQQFTWQALKEGRRLGMGSLTPNRMHWCKK